MILRLSMAASLLGMMQAGTASALPMSYAGSTTLSLDLDPHWSSLAMIKALSTRTGLGPSVQYLPAQPDHSLDDSHSTGAGSHARQGDETFILVDATRLVRRWNLSHAQANLWLFAGVGVYAASGSTWPSSHPQGTEGGGGHAHAGLTTAEALRIAARPGVQFDAETTRLRVEGKAMLYLAPGIQRPLLSATAGVALLEARYEGYQPWLELQLKAMPGVVDQVEWIPKLRVLHHRVVVDVGYSNLGSLVGGLTYTF